MTTKHILRLQFQFQVFDGQKILFGKILFRSRSKMDFWWSLPQVVRLLSTPSVWWEASLHLSVKITNTSCRFFLQLSLPPSPSPHIYKKIRSGPWPGEANCHEWIKRWLTILQSLVQFLASSEQWTVAVEWVLNKVHTVQGTYETSPSGSSLNTGGGRC